MTNGNQPRITPRLILGVAILLAGLAFTLDNFGVVDADQFLDFWPLILVAVGIAKLATASRTGGWLTAGIWVFIGV